MKQITNIRTKNLFASVVLLLAVTWSAGAQTIKTVGTGGDYGTLKAAFDAINAGTITGDIELQIVSSTTETATATLYQSGYTGGGGTSSYSSVKVYPTSNGISISGDLAAPLIDLNGADNLTIDGRVNATGSTKSLEISNYNNSNTSGTSTIRFINDATFNNIRFCVLRGAETDVSSGVVFFSTKVSVGNNNNTIQYNDITSCSDDLRPVNSLFSSQSKNTLIDNNNFYDFLNKSIASTGISFLNTTSTSTISNNRFFETTIFSPTASVNYKIININPSSGNNFSITGNQIGSASSNFTGKWTKTGEYNNEFTGISLAQATGQSVFSNIDNNTIKNIEWANSGNANWTGIKTNSGDINIGTNAGNVIGDTIGNGLINLTAGANGANLYGIYVTNNTTNSIVNVSNNKIGSLQATNVSTFASHLYGIYIGYGSGNINITGNFIGSHTTSNSIYSASASSSSQQLVFGINNNSQGTNTISNNIISNLNNNTTNATTSTTGRINGIYSGYGINTIANNLIKNLSISNANNYETDIASIAGIVLYAGSSSTTKYTVHQNTITNLSNSFETFTGSVSGIIHNGSTQTNIISNNFISNLNVTGVSSNNAKILGINQRSGVATYSNNIISLGGNSATTLYGIFDLGNTNQTCNLFFNTVYIGGNLNDGILNQSFCCFNQTGSNTKNYSNNIFHNTRSTSSGVSKHYAISLPSNSYLTCDFNNYYTSGAGGVMGLFGGVDKTNLTQWSSATTNDKQSISVNSEFLIPGSDIPSDYTPENTFLYGSHVSGIGTDFNQVPRKNTPTIGALEGNLSNLIIDIYKSNILQGSFFSLKSAFDAINAGIHTGEIEIRINETTNEVSSAVLNASGSGSASYSSIIIFPTKTGISITGDLSAPLIDLNGADGVIIDGRVNATGVDKDMTIINHSTGSINTSTIRFYANAQSNTVRYCIIKGSQNNYFAGVIFFGSTISSYGNYNNRIEFNDITNANGNRPKNLIASIPTSSTYYTSNIVISNNNLFDFQNYGTTSNGILIYNYNQRVNITNNSFYETTLIEPTSGGLTNECYVIYVNSTNMGGFSISNNFIGGSAPQCGGLPWRKTNAFTNNFYGIKLFQSSSETGNIQNNTITNFNWDNPTPVIDETSNSFVGIYVSGNVNIGSTTGNIIGSATGNDAILTSGTKIWGINSNSESGTIIIQNNTIGSLTTTNVDTDESSIYCIYLKNPLIINVSNNIIGSTTTANSIRATSKSNNMIQNVYGIYLNANTTGNNTINGNTIANLSNASTNSNPASTGQTIGIASLAGTNTVSNNLIYNLYIANANAATDILNSIGGIILGGSANVNNVTGNTIFNLANANPTFGGQISGIYFNGNTGSNFCRTNFIHSLNVNETSVNASIYGIKAVSGATTYSNNIITIGNNSSNTFYGIYDTGTASQSCNLYFNTVYLGGSPTTGTNNSYAFFSNANSNTRNYRNNIFSNFRSNNGATGKHYAAYFNYGSPGSLTLSNNNYYTAGNGGVLGYYASADVTSLPIISSYDTYSISTNPYFTNAGGTNAVDYKLSFTKPIGVTGTGITVDFGNNTRSPYPAMGAWEFDGPNMWKGNISTDWANSYNWTAGYVPASGADITFDPYPMNHALLDQNRIIGSLNIAQSTYRAVTNGKKLTINGALNLTNGAQIDASASNSTLEFAGTTETQYIQSGILYENKVYNLNVKNPNNVVLSGSLRLLNGLSSESGVLDATTNTPTLIFGGATQQNSSGATLLNGRAYNVTVDNSAGAILTGNMLVENNLTLQQGDLSTENYKLTIQGNTLGNGGYISTNANAGTIEYSGTSAQTIRRIKDNTANSLLVTNTSPEGATIIGTDNSFGDLNTFNQVNVVSGSRLNVAPGEKLTVNNDLTNNGSFVLQSDAQGTATLLTAGTVSTNAGIYKVQQYLTGSNNGSAPNGRFWYMSSPVTGATSATFNPETGLNKLWSWNEPTHSYLQITDNVTPLISGKGYVARMGNTGTVEFSSNTINNGDITVNGLSWTGLTHLNRGYNLIGNPYPSYLNWKDVWVDPNTDELRESGLPNRMRATIWVRSENSTLYTYNAVAGTYATTNPQEDEITESNIQRIAPMQAFWVETYDPVMTDGSITFTNSLRSHQVSSEHRLRAKAATSSEKKMLRLEISDGTNSDQTVIQFNPNAKDSYDLYDSHKMSLSGIPQLYTKVGNEVLSINGMGSFTNEKIVPLGFSVPQAGVYTLKANDISNFSSGTQVLLVDNATASVTDLTLEETYDFTSDKVDNYNRFTIIFRSPGTVTETPITEQGNIVIYRNGDNKITVICNEEIEFNASVTIYTAAGQAIYNKALSGTTTLVNKELIPGVYIARVYNGEKIVSAKVIVE